MAKITKTYSVDQKIYEAFDQVAEEKNINKSSFIENCINKFLDDNSMGHVDRVYVSRVNPGYSVTIKRSDDTFYYLNDDSKISKILFMQSFKEVEQVDPNEFFNNSDIAKNAENIKSFICQTDRKTGFEGFEKLNS